MRRLAIAGFVVLLVLVGAVWFAMSRVEAYVRDNRDALLAQASAALGRDVRFENLGVSLRYGPGVELTQVAVGDDPAFAEGAFVEVDRVLVAVEVLPAIRGRYELSRLILEAPRLTVIRTSDGFNFESMSRGDGDRTATPQVQISDLRVRDGRVRFVDHTAEPAAEVLVEQIDLSAANVGFTTPIEFALAAAVLGGAEQNVQIEGAIGPVESPEGILLAPVDLDGRLGPLEIARARKLPIAGDRIPADFSSDGPIAVEAGVSGTVSNPAVVASLDATSGGIEYGQVFRKPAGTRLVVDASLTYAADAVRVEAITLNLGAAVVRAKGTVGLGDAVSTDLRVSSNDLALADLAAFIPAAAGVEVGGRVDVDLGARGVLTSEIPRLDGSIALRDVRAAHPDGGFDVSGLSLVLAFEGDRIEIPATRFTTAGAPVELEATVTNLGETPVPRLSVRALGGELSGSGSLAAVDGESIVELRGRVDKMDVAQILDLVGASQVQINGVLEGDFLLRSSTSPP